MKHLFCNSELSLKAKEAGFDEPCLCWYNTNGALIETDVEPEEFGYSVSISNILNREITVKHYKAPLYQQLVDWFREKHKWHIYVREFVFENGAEYRWVIRNIRTNMISVGGNLKGYSSSKSETDYYEALNKALETAFTLIN